MFDRSRQLSEDADVPLLRTRSSARHTETLEDTASSTKQWHLQPFPQWRQSLGFLQSVEHNLHHERVQSQRRAQLKRDLRELLA